MRGLTKHIPVGTREYFRARARGRLHQALLRMFAIAERDAQLTRSVWAERIQRRPEQITRWLSYPGNPTVDTLSDLFIGLGYEVERLVLTNLATRQAIELPELLRRSNKMDPKQALLDALQAMIDGDRALAKEYLDNYWEWRRKGGFDPQIEGHKFAAAVELLHQAVTRGSL